LKTEKAVSLASFTFRTDIDFDGDYSGLTSYLPLQIWKKHGVHNSNVLDGYFIFTSALQLYLESLVGEGKGLPSFIWSLEKVEEGSSIFKVGLFLTSLVVAKDFIKEYPEISDGLIRMYQDAVYLSDYLDTQTSTEVKEFKVELSENIPSVPRQVH
jgi:hypothetical protein